MELSARTVDLPPRLDGGATDALAAALGTAVEAPGVRVVALRGSAECFCRGMDVGAATGCGPTLRRFAELLLLLRGTPRATVALVDGEALGGGVGLAAACDVVIATPGARFGLPESLFGLVPGMVLPLVAERVGAAAARRMALRAVSVSAADALDLGLVDLVAADLERAWEREARLLARARPASVAWTKAVPPGLRAAVLAGAEATRERLTDPGVAEAIARYEAGEPPWEVPWVP